MARFKARRNARAVSTETVALPVPVTGERAEMTTLRPHLPTWHEWSPSWAMNCQPVN